MLNRAVKPRILNSEAGPTLPIGAECSAQSGGLGRMNLPRGRGHPIPTTDWAGPLEIFSFGSGPQRYLGAALGDRSAPPVTIWKNSPRIGTKYGLPRGNALQNNLRPRLKMRLTLSALCAPLAPAADLQLGIIGTDTSHVIAVRHRPDGGVRNDRSRGIRHGSRNVAGDFLRDE